MYTILGTDQKEYGPVSADVLRQWIAEGRAVGQTLVKGEGDTGWKRLDELVEFRDALARPGSPPIGQGKPATQATETAPTRQGLAIASLVLGILGVTCFGVLAGIPALVCGVIALVRANRRPAEYSGRGFAIAGVVMGAGSLVVTAILAGMLLPALAAAKSKAQSIQCVNNLKQIGLGARIYSTDNKDMFPTNFAAMSQVLGATSVLICPGDSSRQPAQSWATLSPANISYEFLAPGASQPDLSPTQTIFRCPIHGNIGRADGSVIRGSK
jgi:hypothetical protein